MDRLTTNTMVACTLCRGQSFHEFKLGLVQCGGCGAVLSPATWEPRANEKMEEEWFGDTYDNRENAWTNLFEKLNNARTLRRIESAHPPRRRLLEIGVGSGSFLAAAREKGFEVLGADLSAPICDHVRSKFGINVHCGELTTLPEGQRFDVIVMNHVLEHVSDPVDFLEQVRARLEPGGCVHIAVPNVGCWEAGLSGWTSYEPYHLTYFAPHTLERAVRAAGFEPDYIAARESFSGWFLTFLRTGLGVNRTHGAVTRPQGPAAGTAVGNRNSAVEAAYRMAMITFGAGLWPMRFMQTRLRKGDELICVARSKRAA
jgi:2-polyprenyl-3-methyl-5-hydroxy-6-metoxy-1,4-benzoquinol methylase